MVGGFFVRGMAMKRRVLKKQMKRILNSSFPAMIKLSALNALMKVSQKSSWIQFDDLPYVRFDRISTTSHKGIVTVSEDDRVDEIRFNSWRHAMKWICQQAKRIGEYDVQGSEYIVDSGHYQYRVYFPKIQE